MKHLQKRLQKIQKRGTLVQVSLADTIETQKIQFGTVKGVRKDHFLLNLVAFPTLAATGKTAAIKLEQVEAVQDVDKRIVADSQPEHEVIFLSMPLPARIKTSAMDVQIEAPRIRVATGDPLTKTQSTEMFAALAGLLKRIGKNDDEVLV